MPVFWRRFLLWAALAGAGYWYAQTYGIYAGLPPFTPIFLWDYSGERTYEITLRGSSDALKVRLEGALKQGSLRFWVASGGRRVGRVREYKGRFKHTFKRRLEPGRYVLHFAYRDTRGWVRLDWVSTKYEGW